MDPSFVNTFADRGLISTEDGNKLKKRLQKNCIGCARTASDHGQGRGPASGTRPGVAPGPPTAPSTAGFLSRRLRRKSRRKCGVFPAVSAGAGAREARGLLANPWPSCRSDVFRFWLSGWWPLVCYTFAVEQVTGTVRRWHLHTIRKDQQGRRSITMGRIKAFFQDESGATAIEYGLLAALIAIAAIAAAIPTTPEVYIPGLHLEGPFMAVGGAACPTLPGDLGLLEEMLAACAGRLAVMSVSPDAPGIIPVIRRLRERGVVVFLTHTRANAEDTEAALEAGAVHATHFYDVFLRYI